MSAAVDAILAPFDRPGAPGGAVGVARRGRTIHRRAFGLASLEHGVANSPATRFPLASVSKHFTALAILLLAEDGALGVDDGVRAHIPELPAPLGEPTLRQLMTHTGGLRCYLDIGFADGFALKPAGAALAAQVRQSGANFPPGTRQMYSNGGYHLLSLVVERRSGMAFEDFLRERVFAPMRMDATESVRDDSRVRPGVATPYLEAPGGWRRGFHVSDERLGDGAVVSSLDDMLRWIAHLRAPSRVGGAASWRAMTEPALLPGGAATTYALGLQIETHRGARVIGHGGGHVGASCHMLTVPEHELDVMVMFNMAGPARSCALKIVDAMLGDALAPPQEAPRADEFPALPGRWFEAADGALIGFEAAGDVLGFSFMGAPATPPEGRRGRAGLPFAARLPINDLGFEAGPGPGRVTVLDAGRRRVFARLPDEAPGAAEVAAAARGRYVCDDTQAEAVVRLSGDRLAFECAGRYGEMTFRADPLSPALLLLTADGPLPFAMVAELDVKGRTAAGFTVTTARTIRLPFRRVGDEEDRR